MPRVLVARLAKTSVFVLLTAERLHEANAAHRFLYDCRHVTELIRQAPVAAAE